VWVCTQACWGKGLISHLENQTKIIIYNKLINISQGLYQNKYL
jgi:hypothetical protein